MPVSIYDIAKAAGVSAATVSNVLNDRGRVSEKTRVLVTRVAKEQGYVPNLNARGLRKRSTKTIGIVTPDVSNDYFSSMVLDVERAMHEHGYTSFICNTWYRDAENADYIDELKQRNVDGIFFVGGEQLGDLTILEDTPCAFIDYVYPMRPKRFTIALNNIDKIVYDQTALLIERGCTNPALLMFHPVEKEREESVGIRGFTQSLQDHGIEFDESRLLLTTHDKTSYLVARERMAQKLDEDAGYDGIVCVGDRTALGCCEAIQERGLALGRDIKVIGMDNSLYSRLGSIGISTVERNISRMVKFAVGTMLQMLAGEEPEQQELVVPHRIIERATTLGK